MNALQNRTAATNASYSFFLLTKKEDSAVRYRALTAPVVMGLVPPNASIQRFCRRTR